MRVVVRVGKNFSPQLYVVGANAMFQDDLPIHKEIIDAAKKAGLKHAPDQLAEGWIKRVVRGINPFEQRIKSYADNQVNTIVSMISQAGPRFVGSAPLSAQAANDFGLIEIYETVLKRGIGLSIEGAPAVDYGPANDALLLVSGRLE